MNNATGESMMNFPPCGKWCMGAGILACVVILLWVFPRFWYTHSDAEKGFIWFTGRTSLPGWAFKPLPVAESAERLLAADETLSGEFTNLTDGHVVQVFLAKRFAEKPHDIGLFVHTPDRCWTEAGWRLDPVAPDHLEVEVHGVRITFERRVFVYGNTRRELVLFGGLVGGQPLPYRLDHNLSVGMRSALEKAVKQTGAKLRASDRLLWQRVWESFASRRQLFGPKLFVRISTRLQGDETAAADALLVNMLREWLQKVDFAEDMRNWQKQRSLQRGTSTAEPAVQGLRAGSSMAVCRRRLSVVARAAVGTAKPNPWLDEWAQQCWYVEDADSAAAAPSLKQISVRGRRRARSPKVFKVAGRH